jgi:hypothetical protein
VHLVIDSPAARQSRGVQLEALALNHRTDSWDQPEVSQAPATDRNPGNRKGGRSRETQSEPCCKVCYYRNGILVYCDPPTCGPQCHGAIRQ